MATKIAILGDGAMGTACSIILSANGHEVTLWSAVEGQAAELQEARENRRFLPGVRIPESVRITDEIAEAAEGAELLVVAIPTIYLRQTLRRVASQLSGDRPVVSVVKGMENETFLRPSEIVRELLSERGVVALSGPSHAEEIARRLPATVVAASGDLELAREVQRLFSNSWFRVYTNRDILGVELAAALKNIIGIAAGVCDGLKLGDNAKAALLTRGLVEMTRFGMALGAERETFFGLAGMGDLITTCISPFGRNRHVGELLGQGKKLSEILAGMTAVAEGVWTTRSVYALAEKRGIEMPITIEVYRALFEDKSPLQAVEDLMLREPKGEGW